MRDALLRVWDKIAQRRMGALSNHPPFTSLGNSGVPYKLLLVENYAWFVLSKCLRARSAIWCSQKLRCFDKSVAM